MLAYPCTEHAERIASVEKDVENLIGRMDRFEEGCLRTQKEIKDMIDKALSNELHEVRKKVDELHEVKQEVKNLKIQMKQNGISVKLSLWERLSSLDTILSAIIAGAVALIIAFLT